MNRLDKEELKRELKTFIRQFIKNLNADARYYFETQIDEIVERWCKYEK